MAERLFLFIQLELPWELGPADGRYLLRAEADGEPERVVVLDTLGAPRRGQEGRTTGAARHRGLAARRRPPVAPEPEPETVAVTRATVIDPVSVSAEGQARAWLNDLDVEREAMAAAGALNRMLAAQRIATADPYIRELSPPQALVIRAGWGEGEQVAYGRWLHARELRLSDRRTRGRAAVLRPHERLAAFLGARQRVLLCEELALRARLDLDAGRVALAAIELERAFAAALAELGIEERPELSERLNELAQLNPGVVQAANAALSVEVARPGAAAQAGQGAQPRQATRSQATRPGEAAHPDADAVAHALGRLEATLRARAAAGFKD